MKSLFLKLSCVEGDVLRCVLAFVLTSCCVSVMASQSLAATECAGLFRQKQYRAAAQCFVRDARRIRAPKNVQERDQKAMLLENGARSYERAAMAQLPRAQQYWLREQALALFVTIQKQGLCSAATCPEIAKRRKRLADALAFAGLILDAREAGATLCIRGRWLPKDLSVTPVVRNKSLQQRCVQGQRVSFVKLYPGTYTLLLTIQGQRFQRAFLLQPQDHKRWIFVKPTLRVTTYASTARLMIQRQTLSQKSPASRKLGVARGKAKTRRFGVKALGKWKGRLLPGAYRISVVDVSGLSSTHKVVLKEGQTHNIGVYKVRSEPTGAVVFGAGKRLGTTPLLLWETPKARPQRLLLRYPCRVPRSAVLSFSSRPSSPILVRLSPDPLLKERAAAKKRRRVAGWTVAGIGLAAALLSGTFYGLAESYHRSALDLPRTEENFNNYRSDAERGNQFRWSAHIGLGVSSLGLGVGGYFLLTNPNVGGKLAPCVKTSAMKTRRGLLVARPSPVNGLSVGFVEVVE